MGGQLLLRVAPGLLPHSVCVSGLTLSPQGSCRWTLVRYVCMYTYSPYSIVSAVRYFRAEGLGSSLGKLVLK